MDHLVDKDAFIFVVTGDKGMQEMIAAALRIEGFQRVFLFSSANDVLQSANSVLPEIYIIDYEFPSMTGLELHEQLQAKDRYVPCIFLNAPVSQAEWKYGPLWNLQEPFRIDDLLTCMGSALQYLSHVSLMPWNNQGRSGPNP